MNGFQKITKAKIFYFKDIIKIHDFQVSSMNLFTSEIARVTLLSMAKGEEISAETMPDFRFFFLLQGDVYLDFQNEKIALQKHAFLSLQENSFYSVHAQENSIFLEIQYKTGGIFMADKKTIQHVKRATTFLLKEEIAYEKGQITSKNLVTNSSMVLTVMAFDKGESLAPHTAPGDALITLLEGEAVFTIDNVENIVKEGENIILPAGILHAVKATKAFKMSLLIVK